MMTSFWFLRYLLVYKWAIGLLFGLKHVQPTCHFPGVVQMLLPWCWAVTPRVWLKGIEVTTYIAKGAPFFSGSPLLRTPQLVCLIRSNLGMGDLLGSFSGSVWVRMKHARKTCGDLWGQSTILKAILGNCPRLERGSGHYMIILNN